MRELKESVGMMFACIPCDKLKLQIDQELMKDDAFLAQYHVVDNSVIEVGAKEGGQGKKVKLLSVIEISDKR